MYKILLAIIIFTSVMQNQSIADTFKDKALVNPKKAAELKSQVKKWGEATLIVKDENGKVILNRKEKYPIAEPTIKATANFDNCWNWCRNVCDGYGVCWLSCGWHCSPWTK